MPSKFIQPRAPPPDGALAELDGGAGAVAAAVAVPCNVSSRAGTLPVKRTFQVALRLPLTVGANCAPIEQLVPGSSLPPLIGHSVKPAATGALLKSLTCPVLGATAGLANVAAIVLLFVTSTVTVALVLPTSVLLNITGLGVAVGVGSGANGGGGGGVIAATI